MMSGMGRGPEPGEFDEAKLLATLSSGVDDQRVALREGMDSSRACVLVWHRATDADYGHGHMASLLEHWLTGGWNDLEALDQARAVLDAPDDPRRKRLVKVIHELATGTITWEAFSRRTKKALIPRTRPRLPVAETDATAIPLRSARRALRDELAASGLSLSAPDTSGFWEVFKRFAHMPVAAPRGYVIDNDMCLTEWTASPDTTAEEGLAWSLVRQFSISDLQGNYERMEQLQLLLTYGPEAIGTETHHAGFWSEDDLDNWARDVEGTDAFALATNASPRSASITHERV